MMSIIFRHFKTAFRTMIRKGAIMSERDIRRIYAAAVVGPIIAGILIINEYVEPTETTLLSSMIWWWLVGMMLLPLAVMPPYVYGYHNRHKVDVKDEEPLDFAPGLRGALLGTAFIPIGRFLIDFYQQ